MNLFLSFIVHVFFLYACILDYANVKEVPLFGIL